MTATTIDRPQGGIRLSFAGLLRSEWIKLRSLRSTIWCLGLVVVLSLGISLLLAATLSTQGTLLADQQNRLFVQAATLGAQFTQLIVAVLGVLVISGEYGTGMIRSTFTAAPGRLGAYFAKAIVLLVTSLVVGLVSVAASALVAGPLLAGKGVTAELGTGAVLLPLLGAAAYLALIGTLAFAFGAIVRNTAGGLASILGLLLVAPAVLQLLGGVTQAQWILNVAQFLPSNAGSQAMSYVGETNGPAGPAGALVLDPLQGLLVLVAWVAVGLTLGAVLTKRRDA